MIEVSPEEYWIKLQMNEEVKSFLMVDDPILQLYLINSNGKSDVAKYLLNLNIDGKSGWRLPTYKEIHDIFRSSNWLGSYFCWYFSEFDIGINTTIFWSTKRTSNRNSYADSIKLTIPVRNILQGE